ncbi:Phasin protein [Roseovarius lutimaris]|uniref:Phasin protein n=1 Tax=Roseovarius lutimaris TaxID=1005928 RepID=A0A1I5ENB4_9RHOB|nr:phasin family protein [Roseovarius lutimaris]SFO12949.1 Phasin protein [Roseovarius lutimaris]
MTKSAKKPDAGKPDVSAFSAAMIAGNPAASKLWLDIMAESTRFVSERLQNDLETQKAMLRCQNPTDLVQLQSEFFRKTVEQYTAEAQRLFEIMTEATEGTVKDTKTSTKRSYDDVPL